MVDTANDPTPPVSIPIALSPSPTPTGSTSITPMASPTPPTTPAVTRKSALKPAKDAKDSKPAKDAKPTSQSPAAEGDPKLSAKELKERKKAEKAARRAGAKASAGAPAPQQTGPRPGPKDTPPKGGGKATPAAAQQATGAGGIVKTIYVSATNKATARAAVKEAEVIVEPVKDKGLVGDLSVGQKENKKTAVFGLNNAHSDVHPAILILGMQINQYVLAGSTARCMGFLLAMKRVIHDYETPPTSTLSRHLPGHYLSHQIAYLLSARPMSTAMGNTIRWLKQEIANISPDITQESAKKLLIEKIENFIREKITVADDMIVNTIVARYIKTGDTILTYGKSQIVERALLEARRRGRIFNVIVIDNRPLLEGKNLLQGLVEAGIRCDYVHLYALEHSITSATTVLLGAHAIMADGALYSRAGTASVAVTAKERGIPVVVCCESIKFSDRINLDVIVSNELGDPELLVNMSDTNQRETGPLMGWRDMENTHVSSFRYDVTPSECVKMVVCEHGCVSPNSVASVLRSSTAAGAV